ncbi:hypothetical protein GCM10025789_14930 [Tessaracoccus lubricantis]|uniref:Uncharacterized protein n=1 Tax=Tessaracoccus lubricantis TaxID=545543 RepID=A0ABP9FAP8_9ACTN
MNADEPVAAPETVQRSRRVMFAVGCLAALTVTVIFLTLGDGVGASPAFGLRGVLVEVGHTAAWALLAVAFGLAAVRGRWSKVSNGLALAALGLYVAFLAAVFLG